MEVWSGGLENKAAGANRLLEGGEEEEEEVEEVEDGSWWDCGRKSALCCWGWCWICSILKNVANAAGLLKSPRAFIKKSGPSRIRFS